VCRYEQGHRLPSLRTALALALILDVSITTLFGGMQYEVQKKIAGRIVTLRSELEDKYKSGRVSALASRQLQWLNDHHGHSQSNEHQMQ
jgi:transcriptional regulator with XRE-family HTH domain